MPEIFLSYSRKDQDVALRFADDLIAAGVNLWVDQFNVRPSEQWDRVTEAALIRCDGVLAILSPNSVTSDLVRDEISDALDRRKSVIPVLIAECTPPLRLRRVQYIDARPDYQAALAAVMVQLGGAAGGAQKALEAPPEPPPTAVPPDLDLQGVRDELAALIGPVASVLVRRAAANASNTGELRALLSHAIADEDKRRAFATGVLRRDLTAAPPHEEQAAEPSSLDHLARELMLHVGPVAYALVRRESRTTASHQELCMRLSEKIADGGHRRQFLRRVLHQST